MRKAIEISNWEDAQRKVREWESGTKPPENISVTDGVARFIEDAEARHLSSATLAKIRFVLEKQLVPFCEREGIGRLNQVTPADLIGFRKSWIDKPLSALKKFERLRSFFLFCERNAWCGNPCRGLT